MPSRWNDLALVGEVERRHLDLLVRRCTARRPSRSSCESGKTRKCSPCVRCGRCRGSTARAAGSCGSHWPNSSRWREEALLGAGLLLVAAAAAEGGVEAVLARCASSSVPSAAGCGWPLAVCSTTTPSSMESWTDGDHEADAELGRPRRSRNSSISGKLCPVSTWMQRERDLRRAEGLLRQAQHDDRVLAAREQQDGLLELGGDLTDDVDRLGLELVQLAQLVVGMGRWCTHQIGGPLLGSSRLMLAVGEGRGRGPAVSSPTCRRSGVLHADDAGSVGRVLQLGDRGRAEHRQPLRPPDHAPDQRHQHEHRHPDAGDQDRVGLVLAGPSGAQPALSSSATPDMVRTTTMPRRMNDCGTRGATGCPGSCRAPSR